MIVELPILKSAGAVIVERVKGKVVIGLFGHNAELPHREPELALVNPSIPVHVKLAERVDDPGEFPCEHHLELADDAGNARGYPGLLFPRRSCRRPGGCCPVG